MNILRVQLTVIVYAICIMPVSFSQAEETAYNPLSIAATNGCRQIDLTVSDKPRNRDIPVRVYLPATTNPAPVILFSHGLGGSREGSAYLGRHWSARGYVSVFLQHPGSDTSVWKDAPPAKRMEAMHKAAGLQNFLLRVNDVPAVLDQLERWNITKDHPLYKRLDTEKTGMSGHSFGAVTTQAVSGQKALLGGTRFRDNRIDAAVIMSPSTPKRGSPEKVFSDVNIPWLLMTGTKDLSVIGDADMESRLGVFPALPAGGKYELVLKDAEHSAFTERGLPGDKMKRNPNHHRAILALSTAFWDAYLRNSEAAKKWLNGKEAESILQDGDSWKRK